LPIGVARFAIENKTDIPAIFTAAMQSTSGVASGSTTMADFYLPAL